MFSFQMFSSSTLAQTVNDLIQNWGNKPIASCVLGISKIGIKSNINNNIAHAALLLLNREISYDEDYNEILKTNGILIEYGDYSPKMATTEEEYTKKGLVVYRYGEKGGLRYYTRKYSEFIEQFGDKGYVDLNIDKNNQLDFIQFMDKVAKKEDNKWIQSNYSITNFGNHAFVVEALNKLKPHFNVGNIYFVNQKSNERSLKQRLDFIPFNIKTELMKYYRN